MANQRAVNMHGLSRNFRGWKFPECEPLPTALSTAEPDIEAPEPDIFWV